VVWIEKDVKSRKTHSSLYLKNEVRTIKNDLRI
jgi:hypothetical protein